MEAPALRRRRTSRRRAAGCGSARRRTPRARVRRAPAAATSAPAGRSPPTARATAPAARTPGPRRRPTARARRGTTSTTRHSSGIGWRASSGAGRSDARRRPPSTTRPPSANVHIPTAERAARPPPRRAPARRPSRPCSAASAWATASASFVPDPSPTCGGIASTTRRCAPPASPSASWQRRANVNARSASAPSADSSSAGCASTHDRRAADRHPEPAEAPRAVAGDREHAQVQARGRLDADRVIGSPTARARDAYVGHRFALARPRRLVHEHLQPAQLGTDVLGRRACARARRGSTPRGPRGAPG